MVNWSNHDRVALNEFLNGDLGQKFVRFLEQSRPRFTDDQNDINAMALMGAMMKGYDRALQTLDDMRVVRSPTMPQTNYVETHKD
jgi:hypothetical protein